MIDISHMKPVPGGAFCDGVYSLQPNFIGGRKDGQLAPAEWQPYRRSESGQPLNDNQPLPPRYYVLFADGYSSLLRYVDSALLPADYKYTDDDPGE